MPATLSVVIATNNSSYLDVQLMQTGGTPLTYQYFKLQLRVPGQDWDVDACVVNYGRIYMQADESLTYSVYPLPKNAGAFDARVVTTDSMGVVDVGASYSATVEYRPEIVADTQLARTLSYAQVRDMVTDLRGFDTPLSTADARRMAQFITAAYRKTYDAWRWEEAVITQEVTVASGLVTWAQLRGADYATFFTHDPRSLADRDKCLPVPVRMREATGLWLDTTAATVWVQFIPRAPSFTSTVVDSGATYALGELVLDETTGHCYECLVAGASGADVADAAFWRPLPLLYVLLQPTLSFTEAQWLSRSQERGQADYLRGVAENELTELTLLRPQFPLPVHP